MRVTLCKGWSIRRKSNQWVDRFRKIQIIGICLDVGKILELNFVIWTIHESIYQMCINSYPWLYLKHMFIQIIWEGVTFILETESLWFNCPGTEDTLVRILSWWKGKRVRQIKSELINLKNKKIQKSFSNSSHIFIHFTSFRTLIVKLNWLSIIPLFHNNYTTVNIDWKQNKPYNTSWRFIL